MVRAFVLLLSTAVVVVGCSDRRVEEEGESRRHLAAEWCEDWCTFWYACEPLFRDLPVTDCQQSCESDEAWDWTDECGDLKWEYRECKNEHTCEELRGDPEDPNAAPPCQPEMNQFVLAGCRYDRPRGR